MLPEVHRTFVHDVDAAEVHSARTHAPRVTSTMGIEFIQTTNDIKILFFTYKAKATNVVLESKAKTKD